MSGYIPAPPSQSLAHHGLKSEEPIDGGNDDGNDDGSDGDTEDADNHHAYHKDWSNIGGVVNAALKLF